MAIILGGEMIEEEKRGAQLTDLTLTLAPPSINILTMSPLPCFAAQCNAV